MYKNNGLGELTMGSLFRIHAKSYPENLAIVDIDAGKRYTYEAFNKRINQLANAMLARGIKKGDILSIYMTDCLEWVEVLFAANKIGAVWSPCNFRFTKEELFTQLAHTEPKWVFSGPNSSEVIDHLKANLPCVKEYIVFTDQKDSRWTRYEDLYTDAPDHEPKIDFEIKQDDLVGIIYTSGTTGVPKGVMHTHQTLIGWAYNEVYEFGIVREDKILNPYPMFHLGGIIVGLAAFLAGASNHMLGKFEPVKFLNVIRDEKISLFFAIPTIVHTVLSLPDDIKCQYDMASVRSFLTSSAPLYHETKEAVLKYWPNVEMITLYSCTEIFVSTLRHQDQMRKKLCVGRPAFHTEVKILDENGHEVPQGKMGLVYVRGISRALGYYKNQEADDKAFHEDWLTCEDVGYFDEEGYLYLVDRAKDIIISGGENIASIEVENLLLQHPAIFEAAAVGEKDAKWGEKVHAVISFKPGQSAAPEEIMEWCKGRIAGYKQPRAVTILDALPKTPVGKIIKKEIRAAVNSGGYPAKN